MCAAQVGQFIVEELTAAARKEGLNKIRVSVKGDKITLIEPLRGSGPGAEQPRAGAAAVPAGHKQPATVRS